MSRHHHQWTETRRTFAKPGAHITNIKGVDASTFERLLMGVTTVELECDECCDRKIYEVLGDARHG